jgi:hypothetical protein
LKSADDVRQMGGASILQNVMGMKYGEAQGRHREVKSEESAEQKRGPMYENWT